MLNVWIHILFFHFLVGSAPVPVDFDEFVIPCSAINLNITKDDHRVCIASQMGEVNPVVKRQKGMTPGVMIWKAMEYDFESPLVVSRDTDGTALHQIHLAYICPTSPEIMPWHSL